MLDKLKLFYRSDTNLKCYIKFSLKNLFYNFELSFFLDMSMFLKINCTIFYRENNCLLLFLA